MRLIARHKIAALVALAGLVTIIALPASIIAFFGAMAIASAGMFVVFDEHARRHGR